MNFTKIANETLIKEKQINITDIKQGDSVKAFIGSSAFSDCIPVDQMNTYIVSKLNKKTFSTTCGKKIPLINIRKIM